MKKIFILLLPVLFFCGCGLWDDFTTYFNLYYDTKDVFDQAEKLIKEQKRDIFSTEEIALPGSAGQLLTKVIEKASKILQFHPKSAYTENALMLLGKSFYYEKEHMKALREFQELVKSKPQSGFILEANLWIGKSQMRLKQYDEALKVLSDVKDIAVKKGESDIFEEAYLEQIKYRVVTEDLDKAISLINEFIQVSRNSELNAKVSYELGKIYFKKGDYLNSITAFQSVYLYSPTYDVTLDSKIELARAFRKSGDPQKGLDLMLNMRKEAKYADVYHRIDLETGLCQVELKKVNEGIQALMKIDTAYSNSTSAGMARFELGKIYETKVMNYDSAFKYYQKAFTSSGIDQQLLQTSNDMTQRFKKYQYIRSLINDNTTFLRYTVKPDEFVRDSLANADSIKHQEDLLKESKALNPNENQTNRNETGRYIAPTSNTTQLMNQGTARRPLVRPVIPLDSIKNNIVRSEYDLGSLFFTVLNRSDSAFYYYNDVLNNYPGSKYEADVLYALGSYYETINNFTASDSIYNLIYSNYKTQKVVNSAATKLKKPIIDVDFDPAKQFYAEAESDMIKKDFNTSIKKMFKISDIYPKSLIAPKALYASGWMLENDLKLYDSAAVVYDTLAARYPRSVYTVNIKPKLFAYKDEIQRRKTALADSLQKIEQEKINKHKADSLASAKTLKMSDSLSNLKGAVSDSVKNIRRPRVDSLRNIGMPKTDSLRNLNNPKADSLKNGKGKFPGLKTDSTKINILKPVTDSLRLYQNTTGDSLKSNYPRKPKT